METFTIPAFGEGVISTQGKMIVSHINVQFHTAEVPRRPVSVKLKEVCEHHMLVASTYEKAGCVNMVPAH